MEIKQISISLFQLSTEGRNRLIDFFGQAFAIARKVEEIELTCQALQTFEVSRSHTS